MPRERANVTTLRARQVGMDICLWNERALNEGERASRTEARQTSRCRNETRRNGGGRRRRGRRRRRREREGEKEREQTNQRGNGERSAKRKGQAEYNTVNEKERGRGKEGKCEGSRRRW